LNQTALRLSREVFLNGLGAAPRFYPFLHTLQVKKRPVCFGVPPDEGNRASSISPEAVARATELLVVPKSMPIASARRRSGRVL
jgi:hypothetical protein